MPKGGNREGKTSRRKLEVAERRRKVIELRLAGLKYREIFERYPDLGYRSVSAIAQDVTRALDQFVGEPVRELVAVEMARLERLNQALWPRAMQGDLQAIATGVRLSESRRKLSGLDAADRAGTDQSEVDAYLDHLAGTAPASMLDDELIHDNDNEAGDA